VSGIGDFHLSDSGATILDFDYWIATVPVTARVRGVAPFRLFQNVGYVVFTNSTFTVNFPGQPAEAVGPPVWFNQEAEDAIITAGPGDTITDVHWEITAGYEVWLHIFA
jgi:hypothetical protein